VPRPRRRSDRHAWRQPLRPPDAGPRRALPPDPAAIRHAGARRRGPGAGTEPPRSLRRGAGAVGHMDAPAAAPQRAGCLPGTWREPGGRALAARARGIRVPSAASRKPLRPTPGPPEPRTSPGGREKWRLPRTRVPCAVEAFDADRRDAFAPHAGALPQALRVFQRKVTGSSAPSGCATKGQIGASRQELTWSPRCSRCSRRHDLQWTRIE